MPIGDADSNMFASEIQIRIHTLWNVNWVIQYLFEIVSIYFTNYLLFNPARPYTEI
jgi:hypothetical protein